jgi:hypothetical protein
MVVGVSRALVLVPVDREDWKMRGFDVFAERTIPQRRPGFILGSPLAANLPPVCRPRKRVIRAVLDVLLLRIST